MGLLRFLQLRARGLSRFGIRAGFLCSLVASTQVAHAGFFEMPEITEMPEVQRKSLLKDLDIPSVRERSPDPEAGPRLNITKFRLEGIVEFPELGITKADIESLIEEIRVDLMNEFNVLESGFTEKELEEVGELIGDIEEETMDRHVSELEVQRLVWLVREQRSRRGVTLGQIETVADRITRFYRERGFILAKAYIPKQQVRDGVVTLSLLLGELGKVNVSGNEVYQSKQLTSIFDDWLGVPVTSQVVEENLYLLNDFPGLSASGFFEPGNQVGDTQLNINTRGESRYQSNLRLDNHGSEQTGEYRIFGDIKINNLASQADQLQLAALHAVDPQNSDYLQFRYAIRALTPRLNLELGASNNDFVLGPGNSEAINSLELSGETIQEDIGATYSFKRSRTLSFYGSYKQERIESKVRVGALPGDDGLDDRVKNQSLVFTFDVLNEEAQNLHQGNVELISGDFEKGVEEGQDESYSILRFDYSLLSFWKPFFVDANTRLISRVSLQYSESPLSSINQFSLAGATQVRAYNSNQFSGDVGLFMGLDWILNPPDWFDFDMFDVNIKRVARPFVFIDAAWGETYALVDTLEASDGQLLGSGVGVQFAHANRFQGNVQLAFPLDEKFSSDDVEVDDDVKLVFDFQYSFN